MYDARLIGTWKSDARRTLAEIRARRDIPARSLKVWRKIFGRLELRYTRTRFHSSLDGYRESGRYKVIGKDSRSVVMLSGSAANPSVRQVVFEGRYYWICLGRFREYFRRVA